MIKKKHKLRKPSGPFIVGCSYFTYSYVPEQKYSEPRIVPCLCFYPAQGIGEGKLKKYVSERILPGANGIETNSYFDAPIDNNKHPLILFNHGYDFFCEANTVQCEELASHGFIVLSIGHQGDGQYVLPDGQKMKIDAELRREFSAEAALAMKRVFKYSAWIRDRIDATANEHYDYYKNIIDSHPKMTAHSDVWVNDSLVALNRFLHDSDQDKSMFYNHVDKEKIGAFGMSFGGSTALCLAHLSDLIKASADLDGFFFSPMWREPIQKPIMLIQNDTTVAGHLLKLPFLHAINEAYLVTVKNSTHGNFTDYNEIMADNVIVMGKVGVNVVELPLLGDIDPVRIEGIVNILLVDFFHKYLNGRNPQVIDSDILSDDAILIRK